MSKKLLFIIPIFPKDLNDDTIVPYIFQFTNSFKETHHVAIHVLSFYYPFEKSNYEINGIHVYALGGGFTKTLKNQWTFLKAIIKAFRLYRKNRYDGVLSFWYGKTAIIGLLLKKIYGVKHYTYMQGQDVRSRNKYIRYLKPNPISLITVGESHSAYLYKSHGIKNTHIANVAVRPETFPPLNKSTRSIDIIGVGNLGALKNYTLFIDLISELKKEYPKINCIICGDGEQRAELSEKIKVLGLSENLKLLGYQNNQVTKKFMSNAKIFLHTSTFEGNSMAIQEALFSGCLAISTIPLGKEIPNFYYESTTQKLLNRLQSVLKKDHLAQRIQPFDLNRTTTVVHSCFYDT